MFSSLRLARSRSQGSTAGCAGEKESAVNGDTDRHVDRHVYQVTPQGLSSCPTSPLLSGKPPKTPRSLARRGSSKWGLDRALCPSIGSLRERASRWDDDLGLGTPSSSSDVCTCSKVTRVAVARQDGCLGITVRGGSPQPLIITSVHPGGPADREGSIRPGDRLLAVDGTNLQLADLSTAHSTLRGHQAQSVAVLTIEYSVCVVGAVVGAQGPLLVELARPPAHQLGITLRSSRGPDRRPIVVVDDIKPASVADRSGALHRGDQILAVDEVRVDGTDLNASDVTTLLAEGGAAGSVLRLEVLPAHCLPTGSPQQFCGHQRSPCPSESGLSAYNAVRSLRSYDNGSLASSTAGSGSAAPSAGIVSHTETLAVVLRPEPLSGYGLAVRASGASRIPTISALHPDGPAAKSGCLQVGDRVVAVDEREVDAERLARLLDSPGPPVTLRVSFSVAESVVPASGVFTVKLAKYRPGLGITITGNKTGEYLHISDIKRGSVAHRSGTLAVGDRLLEIDGLSLGAGLSGGRDLGRALDHAARILHNSGEVVTLKVFKDETPSEIDSNWGGWSGSLRGPLSGGWTDNWTRSIEYPLESIVGHHAGPVEYTVELVRHGGPLGLTIAGSEDPSDSVTISGLTPGGLAEQTGALHVGDRLMAINGESLRGRRLSEAIAMFQNSADVVTLKISRKPQGHANLGRRPTPDRKGLPNCEHPGISSVDSALESWESSTSQHDSSPAGKGFSNPPGCSAVNGAGAGSGRGADGAQAAKVKLTPLPLSPPTSNPAPLPRRSGSCPSLDCLLQTEAAGNNPEWDESLEDLDSAAATAASLSMRQEELDASPTSPSISPPADFRLGFEPAWRQTGLGDPGPGRPPETVTSSPARGWPRPPPFPTPSTRLTAAKALNNDWRQRQQRSDTVDSQAISPKLTSFQWTTANGTPVGTPLETTRGDRDEPGSGSLRNLDFSVLNRSLQRVHYDFGVQADAEANLRASSLLLEEEATDALHLHELGLQQSTELYRVTIYKDTVYEDFGFSVSDGLYERGVFINRIRKGGPADATGVLCPYDRILQVNDTRTHDFDCCLTVPLIAAAGDRIQLIVARNPDTAYQLPLEGSHLGSNTVTKTI